MIYLVWCAVGELGWDMSLASRSEDTFFGSFLLSELLTSFQLQSKFIWVLPWAYRFWGFLKYRSFSYRKRRQFSLCSEWFPVFFDQNVQFKISQRRYRFFALYVATFTIKDMMDVLHPVWDCCISDRFDRVPRESFRLSRWNEMVIDVLPKTFPRPMKFCWKALIAVGIWYTLASCEFVGGWVVSGAVYSHPLKLRFCCVVSCKIQGSWISRVTLIDSTNGGAAVYQNSLALWLRFLRCFQYILLLLMIFLIEAAAGVLAYLYADQVHPSLSVCCQCS